MSSGLLTLKAIINFLHSYVCIFTTNNNYLCMFVHAYLCVNIFEIDVFSITRSFVKDLTDRLKNWTVEQVAIQ